MQVRIISVGSKMPEWINKGFNEYAKRLSQINLSLIEIPLEKRGKNISIEQVKQRESERILNEINPKNKVITLEVTGKRYTTEMLAHKLEAFKNQGDSIDIVIGGPDGLAESCSNRADLKLSLSDLTLPHPLVRILLAEQLYRCWSIIQKHPYHRA